MKTRIFLLLFAGYHNFQVWAQNPRTGNIAFKLDGIFTAYAKQDLLSGSFLVSESDKVLFSKAYNLADRDKQLPLTTETAFRIASVSKPFTATAILLLEESGKLSTADKLSKFIPSYPNGDSITIHHLLTHTSGIKDVFKLPYFTDNIIGKPISLIDLINIFKNEPLEFSPGNKFRYSNSGYILLSYIIEQVSRMKFDRFITSHIFKRLRMAHSGMWYEKAKHIAVGYTINRDGFTRALQPHESLLLGAGALYSTTGDLLKFCSALMNNRLLKSETLKKMLTPYTKEGYGYGWYIKEDKGNKTIWHEGGISGFSAYLQYFSKEEIAIIGLKNNDRLALLPDQTIIASVAFQKPYELPVIFEETTIKSKELQSYSGFYQLTPNAKITLSEADGKLVLRTPDGNDYRLYAASKYLFFLKVMDVQCEIVVDENNAVKGLNWIQRGRKRFATKL